MRIYKQLVKVFVPAQKTLVDEVNFFSENFFKYTLVVFIPNMFINTVYIRKRIGCRTLFQYNLPFERLINELRNENRLLLKEIGQHKNEI